MESREKSQRRSKDTKYSSNSTEFYKLLLTFVVFLNVTIMLPTVCYRLIHFFMFFLIIV